MDWSRWQRLLLWLVGTSLIVSALVYSGFRDVEGFLQGTCALPLSAGIAFWVLGFTLGRRLTQAGAWLALGIVGQAVALQLINAGPALHYQHYRPMTQITTGAYPVLLAFLAVQTLLVMIALARRWSAGRTWVAYHFRVWQLAIMGAVFVLTAATVSSTATGFVSELLFAAFVQAVNLGNVVLIALALPEDTLAWLDRQIARRFLTPVEEDGLGPSRLDRFALIGAIGVLFMTATLSAFSYERHPHVTDEVAYLLHARFLADGAITLPAPPVPDAFGFYLMEFQGGSWYPSTPPGWPAILAAGVHFGLGWLVNPFLSGLNVLLFYLLARELYDRRTARMGLVLLCLSPWFVFMGMNFMTHTLTLTCALAAGLTVSWARRTGKLRWAILAGAMIGLSTIVRPLDGLITGVLVGLWVIGIGGKRLKLHCIAGFALGVVAVGAAVLPYNQALTGSPLTFPLNAYVDKHYGPGRNDLGFGPNRGFGWPLDPNPGHSPTDALINSSLNGFSLNVELFGWGTGSLLLIALLLSAGRLRRNDYLMVATCAAVFLAFFFYYYSGGPDFGARYWYLMLVPCVVLTARGLQVLQGKVERIGESGYAGARVIAAVLALCLLAVVNYFPWRAIDKYHHFWGMRPDVRYLAADGKFGASLVLVRGDSHPDYTSAAVYNPLDFQAGEPVYAWEQSPYIREELLKAYADRPVWLVDGPSITGTGFKVVGGPLTGSELRALAENTSETAIDDP